MKMNIQTLVSTINRENVSFLESMNIETEVVVGNQNGQESRRQYDIKGHRVLAINSQAKGLAKNRNLTIENADADICVFADDDIEYYDNYSKIIERAFAETSDADLIIFNLYEEPVKRYIIKKKHRVLGLEFLRYGSVRIAFKRKAVAKIIRFDERFGSGGEIPIGEDTIFLGDCMKKGLKIYAYPNYILRLKPSESTWFRGYDETYFRNKGKMYYRIFGLFSEMIIIQDAVRHRKHYSECANPISVIRFMNNGKKEFRQSCKGKRK